MQIPFIDLSPAVAGIRGEIDAAIRRVLDSGSYLRGRETAAFEEEWADYCGQRYCVTCASGTDALTLGALALRLEHASIQANTIPLTGTGLARASCDVSLLDVGGDGRLAQNPDDQVPVLLYGRRPSPGELGARLFDAAHAHGWRPPRGATACWSFYPTKSLGAFGDGGAITTDDETVARSARALSGLDDQLRDRRQLNSRMDEIQAAILRVKLWRLDDWLAERRELVARYADSLPEHCALVEGQLDGCCHLAVIRTVERPRLSDFLAGRGIQTKVHFRTPLNRLDGPWRRPTSELPGARAWCDEVLSLPCWPGLEPRQVESICEAVGEFAAAPAASKVVD